MHFPPPGYDIKRNDRTWSTKGGVAVLYKSELVLNKLYDDNDFNIIINKGKAPGHDTITHELLRLAIETPFYIHRAKLFAFSLRIGYIPTA